jgi:hypothetical protein
METLGKAWDLVEDLGGLVVGGRVEMARPTPRGEKSSPEHVIGAERVR